MTVSRLVPSVIRGSNGVLIATVARLGYLGGPTSTVLDVTYGRGSWWTRIRPPDSSHDLTHSTASTSGHCLRSIARSRSCAWIRRTSRRAIETTSTVDDLYDRFGLGERQRLASNPQADRSTGLAECARVLAPGGYLLVKCMDYVESGRKVWNTFHVYAEAATARAAPGRPVPPSGRAAALSRWTISTARRASRNTLGRSRRCCFVFTK